MKKATDHSVAFLYLITPNLRDSYKRKRVRGCHCIRGLLIKKDRELAGLLNLSSMVGLRIKVLINVFVEFFWL